MMATRRLLNQIGRRGVAVVIVGAALGQSPAMAQAESAPAATAAQPIASTTPVSVTPDSTAAPSTTPATESSRPASKSKRRRFAAWLRAEYDERAKNVPATQEELVKDADNYNHHRQWIDDCPVDEFIITPGGP
jgi:hypothetical protein